MFSHAREQKEFVYTPCTDFPLIIGQSPIERVTFDWLEPFPGSTIACLELPRRTKNLYLLMYLVQLSDCLPHGLSPHSLSGRFEFRLL